ncbi:MAG: glutaredoxin family protein [Proteobacteria bacterium]|nr:glutaredoxin family protein [Pseudomonadota bacterium]
MSRLSAFCFALFLALAASSALAQTYRWINPKTGGVMITDTPPPGNAKLVDRTQNDRSDPEQGIPYATKRAMDNFPVTLYTSADCATECKDARALLNKRGIPFTEKALKTQEDFDELKTLVGGAFVPSIKVGNQSIKGFLTESYDNLLDLAGYPKTAPYGSKPAVEPAK